MERSLADFSCRDEISFYIIFILMIAKVITTLLLLAREFRDVEGEVQAHACLKWKQRRSIEPWRSSSPSRHRG